MFCEAHNKAIRRLCRRCGTIVNAKKIYNVQAPKAAADYLAVFGIDVRDDNRGEMPTSICAKCRVCAQRGAASHNPNESAMSRLQFAFARVTECSNGDCGLCRRFLSGSDSTAAKSKTIRGTFGCFKCNQVLANKTHVCLGKDIPKAVSAAVSRHLESGHADAIAAAIIRLRADESGCATLRNSRGRSTRIVVVNAKNAARQRRAQAPRVCTRQLRNIYAVGSGVTQLQLRSIQRHLRSTFACASIATIKRERKALGDLFDAQTHMMEYGRKRSPTLKRRTIVMCRRPVQLLQLMLPDNVYVQTSRLKVGIDHGQGFLKVNSKKWKEIENFNKSKLSHR